MGAQSPERAPKQEPEAEPPGISEIVGAQLSIQDFRDLSEGKGRGGEGSTTKVTQPKSSNSRRKTFVGVFWAA